MLHNGTKRNCFFLGVFRCNTWHVFSQILRSIARSAAGILAIWCSQFSFNLGVQELFSPKLVGRNTSDIRKQHPQGLPLLLEAVLPSSPLMPEALFLMNGCRHTK